MDGISSEIMCVELVIENEIKQGLNQRQIAQTYALALRSSWLFDWKTVNMLIVERWGVKALERIKKMALSGKCFETKKGGGTHDQRIGNRSRHRAERLRRV